MKPGSVRRVAISGMVTAAALFAQHLPDPGLLLMDAISSAATNGTVPGSSIAVIPDVSNHLNNLTQPDASHQGTVTCMTNSGHCGILFTSAPNQTFYEIPSSVLLTNHSATVLMIGEMTGNTANGAYFQFGTGDGLYAAHSYGPGFQYGQIYTAGGFGSRPPFVFVPGGVQVWGVTASPTAFGLHVGNQSASETAPALQTVAGGTVGRYNSGYPNKFILYEMIVYGQDESQHYNDIINYAVHTYGASTSVPPRRIIFTGDSIVTTHMDPTYGLSGSQMVQIQAGQNNTAVYNIAQGGACISSSAIAAGCPAIPGGQCNGAAWCSNAAVNIFGSAGGTTDGILVINGGSNDIALKGTSAAAVEAAFAAVANQMHSLGYKIAWQTILPRGDSSPSINSGYFENTRQAVNGWMRAQCCGSTGGVPDALIDVGGDPYVGCPPLQSNPWTENPPPSVNCAFNTTYYYSDWVHPFNQFWQRVVPMYIWPAVSGL